LAVINDTVSFGKMKVICVSKWENSVQYLNITDINYSDYRFKKCQFRHSTSFRRIIVWLLYVFPNETFEKSVPMKIPIMFVY
jgi:hypothetical protein